MSMSINRQFWFTSHQKESDLNQNHDRLARKFLNDSVVAGVHKHGEHTITSLLTFCDMHNSYFQRFSGCVVFATSLSRWE